MAKLALIEPHVRQQVGEWKPQEARLREAQAEAVKEYARAVLDWEMLDKAVDQQIDDQRNFVDWWYGVPDDPDKPRHVRSQGEARKEIADLRFLSVEEAEQLSGIADDKASRWRKHLGARKGYPDDVLDEYRDLLRGPSYRKAMGDRGSEDLRGASGTGENEWFTPAEHIERARKVLGEIDLDPATHPKAQETIGAKHYFTKDDDGLMRDWHGRIWLNPPYAQPLIAEFVHKLVEEYLAGRVTAAILLTHNYTDTAWFHEASASAAAICFTRGRVKFYEPNGTVAAPTQGQAFSYFGSDVTAFGEAFRTVGFVVLPWSA